jgi:hypothetical protein
VRYDQAPVDEWHWCRVYCPAKHGKLALRILIITIGSHLIRRLGHERGVQHLSRNVPPGGRRVRCSVQARMWCSARSFHIKDATAKTLRETAVKTASRKSYLMTDENVAYTKLGREFSGHGTVNHSVNEYARLGGFLFKAVASENSVDWTRGKHRITA